MDINSVDEMFNDILKEESQIPNSPYKNLTETEKQTLKNVIQQNFKDIHTLTLLILQTIQAIDINNPDKNEKENEIMIDGLNSIIDTSIKNFEAAKLPIPNEIRRMQSDMIEYKSKIYKEHNDIQQSLQTGDKSIANNTPKNTPETAETADTSEHQNQKQKQAQLPAAAAVQNNDPTPKDARNTDRTSEDATISKPNDAFPHPDTLGFSSLKNPDDYIKALASRVYHKPEEIEYMKKSDPDFYEIISAVKGEKSTISIKTFEAMHQKLQDPNDKERLETLTKKVEKINTIKIEGEKADANQKQKEKHQIHLLSPRLGYGLNTYQLAMTYFAKELKQKIKSKEITLEESIDEQTEKNIIAYTAGKGRNVASPQTEIKLNLFSAERGGRMNVGNFLIDQIARSLGMLVFAINAWGAMKSGSIDGVMQRIPYMAIGGSVMYGAAQAIFGEGLEKMINPGNMPVSIMKESLNNKHSVAYFKDPWEIALAKQIIVPQNSEQKTEVMNQFKKMKEENVKGKSGEPLKYESNHPDTNKQGKEIRGEDKSAIAKNMCANEFRAGGHFANFLPTDGKIRTPDGKWVEKEEFLRRLEEHEKKLEEHEKKYANNQPGVKRFEMLEMMIGRLAIGKDGKTIQKDSHFQYLDQLHILAKENADTKKQSQ